MPVTRVLDANEILRMCKNRTFQNYLESCKSAGVKLYVSHATWAEVNRQNDDSQTSEYTERTRKMGEKLSIIIKSRHKYDPDKKFKILRRKLPRINSKLSQYQIEVITLVLQHGCEIVTDDDDIINTIKRITTTPSLEKYASRFLSKGRIVIPRPNL